MGSTENRKLLGDENDARTGRDRIRERERETEHYTRGESRMMMMLFGCWKSNSSRRGEHEEHMRFE